jgi:hypothetical protein
MIMASGFNGNGSEGDEQPMESGSDGKYGAGGNHGGNEGNEEQDKSDNDEWGKLGTKKSLKSKRQQQEEAELLKKEEDDEDGNEAKEKEGRETVIDITDNELSVIDRDQGKEIDDVWGAASLAKRKEKAKKYSTQAELDIESETVAESETIAESSTSKEKHPGVAGSAAIDEKAGERYQDLDFGNLPLGTKDADVVRDAKPGSTDLSRWIPRREIEDTPQLRDGKGQRATVEDEEESEGDSRVRVRLDNREESKPGRRGKKSSMSNVHVNRSFDSAEASVDFGNQRNSEERATSRKVHFDTDESHSSSGVQVESGSDEEYTSSEEEEYDDDEDEDDDEWDLIDNQEITPSTSVHRVQPPPRLPHRRPRRMSSDIDDYPYMKPMKPEIRSDHSHHSPNDSFASQPDPYGRSAPGTYVPPYGIYGYPPPPMSSHMPSPYAASPGSYGGAYVPSPVPLPAHSAHTGLQNGPYIPFGGTSAYPPGLGSMEPPPPPPPSPPPNSSALQPPGAEETASDSEGSVHPYPSRQNPRSKSRKWKQRRHSKRPYYDKYDHVGATHLQGDAKKSKCHPYNIPFGDHGEQLSVNIRLRGPVMKQLTENNILRSSLVGDFGLRKSNRTHTKLIVGAKRWFDSINQYTLDLTCLSGSKDEETTQDAIRWLHVEEQCPDFEDFKAIVMSSDPNLSSEWSVVLLGLLERVRKLHYDHSTGRFSPWMLRADGSELALQDPADTTLSAITVNFPYFALGSIFGHGPRNTKNQFPVMSLFECDDRFESAKEWDLEQSFRLMNSGSGDKESIVYVPHVWAVVFDNSKSL